MEGFQRVDIGTPTPFYFDSASGLLVGDARDENFIRSTEGEIVPIDLVIGHPGPELLDGLYIISNVLYTSYAFHVGNFRINVILKDGRVANIGYRKDDQTPFTPEEVEELKDKNGLDYGVVWSNNPVITDK